MRISLKHTILLSTALFTMNLSLVAMEPGKSEEGGTKDKLVVASEIPSTNSSDLKTAEPEVTPLSSFHLENAKKFSKKFFGVEVEDSFPIFYKISELFNDKVKAEAAEGTEIASNLTKQIKNKGGSAKKSATPASQHKTTAAVTDSKTEPSAESAQLTLNFQRFTSGEFTLTAQHFNRPHPDFNEIYTTLADNFLETTLQTEVDSKILGVTETIKRLSAIHDHFKELIGERNTKIKDLQATIPNSEVSAYTPAAKIAAENLIRQYNVENIELKERFKNLLHHFSTTRSFIIQASETIASNNKIIQASSSTDLTFKNTGELTSITNAQLQKDIDYLNRLKVEAETLLHTLYDFDRTDLHLEQTSNTIAKGVVLLQSALSSVAGMLTNRLSENRTLRFEQTGFSVLPHSITISALFSPDKCDGSTDKALHDRYIEYVQKMMKPKPVLFDAIKTQRLQFIELNVNAASLDSRAQSKSSADATDTNKDGDKKPDVVVAEDK